MELNEIVALLETQFPGVRKDGLNQLARVIAMQVNTKEEATGFGGKFTYDTGSFFLEIGRASCREKVEISGSVVS